MSKSLLLAVESLQKLMDVKIRSKSREGIVGWRKHSSAFALFAMRDSMEM
jgi:hypothetical protein